MAEYIVTDPKTGRKIRLTGDSPPTDAELEEIFASLPQERQPVPRDERPYGERARESLLSSPESGALYGMARPFLGAAQLGMAAGEAITGSDSDLSGRMGGAMREYEQSRREAGASPVPMFAGQVITGSALTKGFAPATGFIGRAGQSLGIGAGMGAVEPVTGDGNFAAQKGAQVGIGAAVGGATSLLGSMFTTLYNRLSNRGQQIVAGRTANQAAGSRADDVMDALGGRPAERSGAWPQDTRAVSPAAQMGPPALSRETAAQAAAPAGSAEFSALQRQASYAAPSDYEAIRVAQDATRVQALGRMAGSADDMATAETARRSATQPLYQAAERSKELADPKRTINLIDRIRNRTKNEEAFGVLDRVRNTMFEAYPAQNRARDSWNITRGAISDYQGAAPRELIQARQILNQAKNFDIDEFTAIARLQALRPQDAQAREVIRGAIQNLEVPGQVMTESVPNLISASRNIRNLMDARSPDGARVNNAIARELSVIKKSLDRQIAKAAPEYGEAQRLFADLSKPIDRMNAARYIQDRLIPALNDAGAEAPQRAAAYAQAMREMNESVSRATGFKRGGGLADLMTPDEMQELTKIGRGLARDADVQRLARAGGRRGTDLVNEMFSEQSPNALSRPLMILNAVLRRTGAGASERTMGILADAMQNPQEMARIMAMATDAEQRAFERGMILYLTNNAAANADDAVSWSSRTVRTLANMIDGEDNQ